MHGIVTIEPAAHLTSESIIKELSIFGKIDKVGFEGNGDWRVAFACFSSSISAKNAADKGQFRIDGMNVLVEFSENYEDYINDSESNIDTNPDPEFSIDQKAPISANSHESSLDSENHTLIQSQDQDQNCHSSQDKKSYADDQLRFSSQFDMNAQEQNDSDVDLDNYKNTTKSLSNGIHSKRHRHRVIRTAHGNSLRRRPRRRRRHHLRRRRRKLSSNSSAVLEAPNPSETSTTENSYGHHHVHYSHSHRISNSDSQSSSDYSYSTYSSYSSSSYSTYSSYSSYSTYGSDYSYSSYSSYSSSSSSSPPRRVYRRRHHNTSIRH